ncbi:MAG: cell division protein FtsZ [Flavobacteriales bacterium]|jgi:cell division protein FtsZ|nr:cell division protein FtsZ [Flavobacteriales bacterium]MBT7481724.1 cell division protein FtsZ [Flavobacteriales bacterium]
MSEKDNIIDFNLPKNKSSVIKVIGIGGGGGNAINYMYKNGIAGVDFVICNTDTQALEASDIPVKIQLGESLTGGLGAGSNPETGRQAALESIDKINELLDANTEMLFITAGMGGGTGTGAAPVVAQAARDKGILTVGVVTVPFHTEGGRRKEHAKNGLEELRNNVDTLLIIDNEKLIEVYGDLTLKRAFGKANEVLNTATKGIAEVISQYLDINIDLNDARLVLENSGTAIMGQAISEGENRAIDAVKQALDSPLLNDNDIRGSKHVLLKIVTGEEDDEISMNELKIINNAIQQAAGSDVNIILGAGTDSELGNQLSITVIATGFKVKEEPKDIYIGIGEGNLESLNNKKIEQAPEAITEDFSQQSMFDFDKQDYKDTIDYIEENQETEVEDEEGLLDFEVTDIEEENNVVEFDLDEPSEKIVLNLEDDVEEVMTDEVEEIVNKIEEVEEKEVKTPDLQINPQQTQENEITSRKRDEKLKNISNILRTPSGLTNLIDEPAYKRNGIDLEEVPHSSESEISRHTLSLGDDNSVQIKPNNSFLHDNVD